MAVNPTIIPKAKRRVYEEISLLLGDLEVKYELNAKWKDQSNQELEWLYKLEANIGNATTQFASIGDVATYPIAGERGEAHGCVIQRRKMRGVATNVYLWKTSEKPKETGHEEYSRFGSCIYVWGRY